MKTRKKTEMNTLPCDVVKDLYPTIKDNCAGAITYKLVTEHLSTCTDCRYFYREWDINAKCEVKKRPSGDFLKIAKRMRARNNAMLFGTATMLTALALYAVLGKKG